MNNELDSVCPIFVCLKVSEKIEQIGSGVLLQIKNQVFILTAAHVTDWKEKGELCIPTKNGIEGIEGHIAGIVLPKGVSRTKDKIDMSYFCLSKSLVGKLHKSFKPLTLEDCWLTDNTQPKDIYSFSGFPLSKAKTLNDKYTSEMMTYSGVSTSFTKYEKLGYSDDTNIVIDFRRKKSANIDGVKNMPPHPKGISGGAIFRWPKDPDIEPKYFKRTLVGIGHTYLQKHNTLIGTKLSLYIPLIGNNHPELFEEEKIKNNDIPLFICLVGYKKEEWSLLMSEFEDSKQMQGTWAQWRNSVEIGLEQFNKKNQQAVLIELSAQEIDNYCKSNKLPNIGQTRGELASRKLVELMKEVDI